MTESFTRGENSRRISLSATDAATRIPIIHGYSDTLSQREITLIDCIRIGMTTDGQFSKQEYRPDIAVLGHHLHSPEELTVKRCEIEFSQLDTWLDIGGFDLQVRGGVLRAEGREAYTVTYDPPGLPTVTTPGTSLQFQLRSTPPIFATRLYPLGEWSSVIVTPDREIHFDSLHAGFL